MERGSNTKRRDTNNISLVEKNTFEYDTKCPKTSKNYYENFE